MANNVLITPKSFLRQSEEAIALLKQHGYGIIENRFGRTLTESETMEICKQDVVGIIVGIDPLSAKVLENSRDLRAISKYGVGLDNVDVDKAKELGIDIRIAAGTNSVSVAELAIGLMLTLTRNLASLAYHVKHGSWDRVIGMELTGKRLGMIGCGQIGREVAIRAKGLCMEVSIYDPYLTNDSFVVENGFKLCADLNEIFNDSDVVSVHVPLTNDTRGIINAESLSKMRHTAILINTSRGELVDEKALYVALANGDIRGAASDVFSSEPPNSDEPLLALDNFILTPHIGAFTDEAVKRMVMVSTQNLIQQLEGSSK